MTDRGPLFVIGCPRSGTTLLLDLLAGSGAFGYVATSGVRRDLDESLHGRTRIYDLPVVGPALYLHRSMALGAAARLGPLGPVTRRRLPSAIEPWEFWSDLVPGFRPEFGDGPAVDPDPAALDDATIARARDAVAHLLALQRRTVLLSKYTDPRVALQRALFPDARFVHIRRDAHAVATSYAVEIESGRFGTWAYRDWWSAAWREAARAHWHAHGATPLGFAAHNRNHLVACVDAATANDPGAMTTSYEELTADPAGTVRRILAFAGLAPRIDLHRLVRSRDIRNTNERWRSTRTPEEAALLDDILTPAAPTEG